MAKQVQAFIANDGTVFLDKAKCDAYEASSIRGSKLRDLADTIVVEIDNDRETLRGLIPLLVSHADDFIAALTVKPEVRRGRKPKSEAVAPVSPGQAAEPANEVISTVAAVA